jgi:hypothetical protein
MTTAKSKLVRVDINKDVVAEASAAAAARKAGTNDWADKRQHYLVLRQRGGSVKWTVRGFKKQRVIGDPRDGLGRRDYLPTSAARARSLPAPNPHHGSPRRLQRPRFGPGRSSISNTKP